jgi:tRNA(Arg) A34 adenosine deaminase TadA
MPRYVVHAEMNAILNKNSASVAAGRMYVALFPCNECAKLIIQSGIDEVGWWAVAVTVVVVVVDTWTLVVDWVGGAV